MVSNERDKKTTTPFIDSSSVFDVKACSFLVIEYRKLFWWENRKTKTFVPVCQLAKNVAKSRHRRMNTEWLCWGFCKCTSSHLQATMEYETENTWTWPLIKTHGASERTWHAHGTSPGFALLGILDFLPTFSRFLFKGISGSFDSRWRLGVLGMVNPKMPLTSTRETPPEPLQALEWLLKGIPCKNP